MSIIERAAKRLEELYKAGVNVASLDRSGADIEPGAVPDSGSLPDDVPYLPSASSTGAHSRHTGYPGAQPARSSVSRQVSIDLARLAQLGFVTPEDPRSQIAEEFRIIKRPLIRNATGKSAGPIRNGNLIMITSALPGEGKSSTALNLAISIAMEVDSTVLLVDADVAKPSIPQLLDIQPDRGLLDVLVDGNIDLSDLLLGTNVERLRLLPSGTAHPRATELLASDAMNRLLADMASRYADRIIIFDSPPLLLTTEARVLASYMGQIVFVVEAEHTLQSAVKQALATIEACPVKLLLLNKSQLGSSGSYYGYHGHKGYARYGYGR
jgi:receptor protein-tyrosine kinase